jgi:hypothetical protein
MISWIANVVGGLEGLSYLGAALFGHDKSSYAAILNSPLAACRPE